MSPDSILLPSIAMFFLSFFLFLGMGYKRFRATASRRVSVKFYQLYNEGAEPPDMRVMTRHMQNHFEVPPLFHIACVALFSTGHVTNLALIFAWTFVGLRLIHSVIHLNSNNVLHRFAVFGMSLCAVAGLWVCLLFGILAK